MVDIIYILHKLIHRDLKLENFIIHMNKIITSEINDLDFSTID